MLQIGVARRIEKRHAPRLQRLRHRRRNVVGHEQRLLSQALQLVQHGAERGGPHRAFHFYCVQSLVRAMRKAHQRVCAGTPKRGLLLYKLSREAERPRHVQRGIEQVAVGGLGLGVHLWILSNIHGQM